MKDSRIGLGILAAFFWMLTLPCSGQFLSSKGRFSVDYTRGCTGMTINVSDTIPSTTTYGYYYAIPDDLNEPTTNDTTHTYTAPGEYTIIQIINDTSLGDNTDSLTISVIDPSQLDFKVHTCTDNQIKVAIQEDTFDEYLVNYAGLGTESILPLSTGNVFNFVTTDSYNISVTGQFSDGFNNCTGVTQRIETVNTIPTPSLSVETTQQSTNGEIILTHNLEENRAYDLLQGSTPNNLNTGSSISDSATILSNISTTGSNHCFTINTLDECSNEITSSGIICNTALEISSDSLGNLLVWNLSSDNEIQTEIIKDDTTTLISDNPNEYLDEDILCGQAYTYRIKTTYENGFSISAPLEVTNLEASQTPKIDSPPQSSFTNTNEVLISWTSPHLESQDNYIIEKRTAQRDWFEWQETDSTAITDSDISILEFPEYRIKHAQNCNGLVPSISTTPIILQESNQQGQQITYEWTRYSEWESGIRGYVLQQLNSQGEVIKEFPVLSGRTRTVDYSDLDNQEIIMRVLALSLDNTPLTTYSNTIKSNLETTLSFPTAFTPDRDGLNDLFTFQGPAITDFKLSIYNRWGNLVFESTRDIRSWDGNYGSKEAPEGIYIYKATYKNEQGNAISQNGAVKLLRNQ